MSAKKNTDKDALLEIGVEELPARFITPALDQLKELARKALEDAGIGVMSIDVVGTPRRLSLLLSGLAPQAEDRTETVIGPPPRTAKDDQGTDDDVDLPAPIVVDEAVRKETEARVAERTDRVEDATEP